MGDQALFNTGRPMLDRQRDPPFSLEIEFSEYRRSREYTGDLTADSWIPTHLRLGFSVRLVAERTYQSFLLEARGPAPRPDGNATLVGEWVRVPAISKHIHCLGRRRSAVSDKE